MKAQRRHELKENALGHELSRVWQFIRKHSNWIAGGILVVAIVALGIYWVVSRSQEADRKVATDYYVAHRSGDLARLQEVANQTRNKYLAAMAWTDIGDIRSMQLLNTRDEAGRKAARDEAHKAYSTVVTQFADQREAVARAQFGLAKLYEDAGDWANADNAYGAAMKAAGPGNPLHDQSQSGREALKRLESERVKFATTATSRPAASRPASASAPSSRAAVGDTTIPAGPSARRPATQPK